MFGRLTWQAIPWSEPIPLAAAGVVGLGLAAVVVWVFVKGYAPYIWKEWIQCRS